MAMDSTYLFDHQKIQYAKSYIASNILGGKGNTAVAEFHPPSNWLGFCNSTH